MNVWKGKYNHPYQLTINNNNNTYQLWNIVFVESSHGIIALFAVNSLWFVRLTTTQSHTVKLTIKIWNFFKIYQEVEYLRI